MFKSISKPRVKVLDVEAGIVEATVSDESEDRDGDIIRASGWVLDAFHEHPVLLADHDYTIEATIGRWESMDIVGNELRGIAKYQIGRGNYKADRAFAIAQDGDAAFSVGFMPVESSPRKGVRGLEFTKQELLEVSQVAVPSNRNARQLMAGARQKWPYDETPYAGHCIVVGCDDAAMIYPPVCEEHLKALVNSPAEPAVGQPVEESFAALIAKAGRVLSQSNLDSLHEAMAALSGVHEGACDGADCPAAKIAKPKFDPQSLRLSFSSAIQEAIRHG